MWTGQNSFILHCDCPFFCIKSQWLCAKRWQMAQGMKGSNAHVMPFKIKHLGVSGFSNFSILYNGKYIA